METKTLMAYEKITSEKADQLLKAHLSKTVKVSDDEPSYYKHIREAGFYEGIVNYLILRDPTWIMDQLNLIEVRHEVHEVIADEIETNFVEGYLTKALAEYVLNRKSDENPEKIYRLVTKIYQKENL